METRPSRDNPSTAAPLRSLAVVCGLGRAPDWPADQAPTGMAHLPPHLPGAAESAEWHLKSGWRQRVSMVRPEEWPHLRPSAPSFSGNPSPARRPNELGERNVGQLDGPVVLLSKDTGLHITCLDAQRAMRGGGPTQTACNDRHALDGHRHTRTGSTSERERDTWVGPHGTGEVGPAQSSPKHPSTRTEDTRVPPLGQALVIRWPC